MPANRHHYHHTHHHVISTRDDNCHRWFYYHDVKVDWVYFWTLPFAFVGRTALRLLRLTEITYIYRVWSLFLRIYFVPYWQRSRLAITVHTSSSLLILCFFFYYCYTPEQIRCRQNELFTLLNYSLTYCKPKWIIISMGTCYSGFSGNWQNKLQMREEKIEFVELFCCSLHGHQSSNFAMWSDCRMLGANDNWVNHRWSVG